MSETYESLWKTRTEQHDLNHDTNIRNGVKDPSCTKCNPVKEEVNEKFQRFWKWYSRVTTAVAFTQRTIEEFEEMLKEDVSNRDRRDQIIKRMMRIFESIRYSKDPEITDVTLRKMTIEIFFCSQNFKLNEEDTDKRIEELNRSTNVTEENTPEENTPERNTPEKEILQEKQNEEIDLDESYERKEESSYTREITETMNRRIEQ